MIWGTAGLKRIACLVAFLLGAWFAARFFGAENVDVRVPSERFWAACGVAFAMSMTFTTLEKWMRYAAPGFRYAWLTALVALLAIFLLGASVTRLICLIVQGQVIGIDAVAASFFLMSLCLAAGIALPRFAVAMWMTRRESR
jgi:hypothetical protein